MDMTTIDRGLRLALAGLLFTAGGALSAGECEPVEQAPNINISLPKDAATPVALENASVCVSSQGSISFSYPKTDWRERKAKITFEDGSPLLRAGGHTVGELVVVTGTTEMAAVVDECDPCDFDYSIVVEGTKNPAGTGTITVVVE